MKTPEYLLERDNLQPYILTSPPDILDVLQSLRNRGTTLRSYIEPTSQTAHTFLLDVSTRNNALVLSMERTESEVAGEDFLATQSALTEASLGTSHVQFLGQQAAPYDSEKYTAIRLPIPSQLLHVQRRDNYRMMVPVTNPVQCTISPGSSKKPFTISVEDISGGGVCLADNNQDIDHVVGKTYPDCSIDLPGVGTITVTLQLAHVTPQPGLAGHPRYMRVGCAFVQANGSTVAMVQRYITQLEREEIARKRGFI